MELSEKIVTTIPLDSLWTDTEEIEAERTKYLDAGEVRELLKKGAVQFVIANPGDKLRWIEIEDCYDTYKSTFKNRIIDTPDDIDLTSFGDETGYLASLWLGKSDVPIVLLELFH